MPEKWLWAGSRRNKLAQTPQQADPSVHLEQHISPSGRKKMELPHRTLRIRCDFLPCFFGGGKSGRNPKKIISI